MKLHIYPSSLDTARALILHIIQMMTDEPDKKFNFAFSGGTTPAQMYDLWANEYADITPWEQMNVWWVDERCVPPENSDSNFRLMRMLLLDLVPIPKNQIFRLKGEAEPNREVLRYIDLIKEHLPMSGMFPVFDMVLLGVGADGHTLSIYPGQETLLSSPYIYEISSNPYNRQKRITLTGQPIIRSGEVVFMVTGINKAEAIYQVCNSGDTSPAGYLARRARKVNMYIDKDAASLIISQELIRT